MTWVHESEVEAMPGSGGDGHTLKHVVAPWTLGSKELWVGVATLEAGVATRPTALDAEAVHVTLEGSGLEIVAGEEIPTRQGTFVLIPRHALHQVINDGPEPLRVLTMATPPLPRPEQ